MKNFMKSIAWLILTIFFGLLQLWLLIGYDKTNSNFSLNADQLILDGILLFFCSALVTSITLDYHFDEKTNLPKWASGVLFSFFPIVIVALSIWLFSTSHVTPLENLEIDNVRSINFIVVTMSAIYTVTTKTLTFTLGGVQ